jgi:hypothetical protein
MGQIICIWMCRKETMVLEKVREKMKKSHNMMVLNKGKKRKIRTLVHLTKAVRNVLNQQRKMR